eukprot:2119474-Pyramimonas_sp.AAC.1
MSRLECKLRAVRDDFDDSGRGNINPYSGKVEAVSLLQGCRLKDGCIARESVVRGSIWHTQSVTPRAVHFPHAGKRRARSHTTKSDHSLVPASILLNRNNQNSTATVLHLCCTALYIKVARAAPRVHGLVGRPPLLLWAANVLSYRVKRVCRTPGVWGGGLSATPRRTPPSSSPSRDTIVTLSGSV